jgi:hypothetical protein
MDWKTIFFGEKLYQKLVLKAEKRFYSSAEAEEAFNYALDALSKDEWKKLGDFEGVASPQTFIQTVFNNSLEDFQRAKHGYPRPPTWVRNLGIHWKNIWKMLCLERKPIPEIQNIFSGKDLLLDHEVSDIVRTLHGRITDCGKVTGELSVKSLEDEGSADIQPSDAISPEVMNDYEDVAEIYTSLREFYLDDSAETSQPSVFHSLDLSDDQLILLRLLYQQKMNKSKAAKMLNKSVHIVTRELKVTLEVIKADFQKQGIQLGDFNFDDGSNFA